MCGGIYVWGHLCVWDSFLRNYATADAQRTDVVRKQALPALRHALLEHAQVCACVHVRVCTNLMHVCVSTCVCSRLYSCDACVCVNTCGCGNVCLPVRVDLCMCLCLHMCVSTRPGV